MKLKAISTVSALSLAIVFSACGTATTNSNVVNKAANAANTVANTAGNMTNTVANAVSPNTTSNSNSMASTNGDVLKIDEAGIMMTVPKGFKFSKDGEDTIVQTDDEGVDIRFTVPKDGDYDKVVADAANEIDEYLNDVKIEDKGSKIDVSGMEGTSMGGTAKDEDGKIVNWNLTVIKAPKKPVLVNIYAEKASLEKHAADVEAFLDSVKKQ